MTVTVTAESIADARKRGLNIDGYARELGITGEALRYQFRKQGLTWMPPPSGPRKKVASASMCGRGHEKSKYWVSYQGRGQCTECNRVRTAKWKQAMAGKVSNRVAYTWLDWMEACTRESNQNIPHWVPKKSDAIKAWLVANKVQP